jgi:hypothetical protein
MLKFDDGNGNGVGERAPTTLIQRTVPVPARVAFYCVAHCACFPSVFNEWGEGGVEHIGILTRSRDDG